MKHIITFNGKPVPADAGDTLFEAALGGSLLIPTDCNAGQCGSCRVRIISGECDDKGSRDGDTVLACVSCVSGAATVAFEMLPPPVKRSGAISEINTLSPEMVEVVVRLSVPLAYRPGQYVRAKFAGYPAREYSPTVRLDGSEAPDELIFHIRRLSNGIVSSAIGEGIRPGLGVTVQGPFGSAYLREEDEGPLVLVSGGSGWAPIWAVAKAARARQRGREVHVVAGSRDASNLYMRRSLDWLREDGASSVTATAEAGSGDDLRRGAPTEFLPAIGPTHTVYVAGPPGLVDAVRARARAADARCYADPFLPNGRGPSLMDRLTRTFNGLNRRRS